MPINLFHCVGSHALQYEHGHAYWQMRTETTVENTRISVRLDNQRQVHIAWTIGNDLRNNILLY